jgi:acetyl esterase/lipase
MRIDMESGSLMDPASQRSITHQLAKMTQGRCFVIRYRLAPSHPFPAGLLDALVAYLSLLYPPPGSVHSAVAESKICFSGDSAGGGMAMALIQAILELQRQTCDGHAKVHWFGEERELPLPAGAAIKSGWFDLTRSMDSIETNAKYDYIPTPRELSPSRYTSDAIWPANPPRHEFYANDDALCHPLISLVTAKDWRGAPPLWFVTGEECLFDEISFVAQQLVNQDVPLVFEYYRAMPHNFAMVLPRHASTQKCFLSWTEFLMAAVTNPGNIETSAVEIAAKTLKENPLNLKMLSPHTMGEIRIRMNKAMYDMLKDQGLRPTSKL